VIVDVVLPAMLSLVLIWETSVVTSSHELEGFGDISAKLLWVGHLDVGHFVRAGGSAQL